MKSNLILHPYLRFTNGRQGLFLFDMRLGQATKIPNKWWKYCQNGILFDPENIPTEMHSFLVDKGYVNEVWSEVGINFIGPSTFYSSPSLVNIFEFELFESNISVLLSLLDDYRVFEGYVLIHCKEFANIDDLEAIRDRFAYLDISYVLDADRAAIVAESNLNYIYRYEDINGHPDNHFRIAINRSTYLESQSSHIYFNKRIYIDADLKIYESSHRNIYLGRLYLEHNYYDQIENIICKNDKLRELWSITKSQCEGCHDCVFRNYCCDKRFPKPTGVTDYYTFDQKCIHEG